MTCFKKERLIKLLNKYKELFLPKIMAQVDFSYLDKFAGEKVKVTLQLNPEYYERETTRENKGRIMPGSNWERLIFLEGAHNPEHDSGKLISITTPYFGNICSHKWSTMPFDTPTKIPYLGITQTFWKIERLEDGLVLFDHLPISKDTYNLVNHNAMVLGQITLPLPFNSPYNCYEALGSNEKKHMEEFSAWRENIVRC